MKRKQLVSALFAIAVCSIAALPAQAITPMAAARQKVFGIENVDANTGAVKKDRVIISWMTNTTYAVSILGRVILLDSYVTRLELTQGRTNFDGRTRDLRVAIDSHRSGSLANGDASEANVVVDRFEMLADRDKQDVLNFLRSL